MKCTKCGTEHEAKFCPNCGESAQQNQYANNQQPTYKQQSTYQNNTTQTPIKQSSMGITALVLCATGCLGIVGLIIAIVDLAKKDTTKKHTCSKIAIGIFVVYLLIGVAMNIGSKNNSAETVNNIETESEESASVEEEPKVEEEKTVVAEEKKEEIEYTKVSSTDLIASYKDNQVKCKQLYDGIDLEVTGTVTSVGTDVLDSVYVCLGSDTDEYTIVGIQCYAKDKDVENEIAELSEGDVITVRGKGNCGSLSFSLRKSEIVK